jgi:glycine/D-amino acid oxidase-like deaminating enzyme
MTDPCIKARAVWAGGAGMARIDVTVRGAGVLGLACAFACAERGARVRVIDPGGVGAGASGGVVGALSPHAPEGWDEGKAAQLESLRMAEGFWARVREARGGDPGHARTGRLMPLADAKGVEVARRREEGARALWGEAGEWRVEPAAGGWGPVSPEGLWVRDTLAARVAPGGRSERWRRRSRPWAGRCCEGRRKREPC